jgi:hypothetical protein
LDQDEYMQECAMVFAYCKDKYILHPTKASTRKVHERTPQWFMSIYMRALLTHRTRIGDKDQAYRKVIDPSAAPLLDAYDVEWKMSGAVGRYTNPADPSSYAGMFAAAFQQASSEFQSVISILLDAPQETLDALLAGVEKGEALDRRNRHTINARLRKLCGMPQDLDFVQELRSLLG